MFLLILHTESANVFATLGETECTDTYFGTVNLLFRKQPSISYWQHFLKFSILIQWLSLRTLFIPSNITSETEILRKERQHGYNKMAHVNCEGPDQPSYPRSLTRVFAVFSKLSWRYMYKYGVVEQRRPWSIFEWAFVVRIWQLVGSPMLNHGWLIYYAQSES